LEAICNTREKEESEDMKLIYEGDEIRKRDELMRE